MLIVWSLQKKLKIGSLGFITVKEIEGFYVLTANLLTTQGLLRYNSLLMGKGY